jgi:diacylglycerol kinase (ATP)
MRKAALLYNPDSGGSKQRRKDLESALSILKADGVDAQLLPTDSRDHAGDEARRAIASGCDTIFACGGDGTIHNILQVLAHTQAALAVLPMGTANALAHDLGLPMRVPAAAQAALHGVRKRVALGQVSCVGLKQTAVTRYFIVAAGVGVDAHLFYKLHTGTKQRLGMGAYYAKAWHMWFSYPMPRFRVEFREESTGATGQADVTELLAVRIRQFGGIVRELAPGASLDRDDVRLVLCRTASRLRYLAHVTKSLLGVSGPTVPGIDLRYSRSASCKYRDGTDAQGKIYVEADGELLGSLPAEIGVIPDALTVLAAR